MMNFITPLTVNTFPTFLAIARVGTLVVYTRPIMPTRGITVTLVDILNIKQHYKFVV